MIRLNPPSPGFASATVFLSASLWGLYWLPLRALEEWGIEGGWAVAALNLPAAMVLLPLVVWTWSRHRPYLREAAIIGVMTGLGLALYASGLIYSSVVRATLLFYLTPVWATLLGIFWLGEHASWPRWAAIGVGLVGLLLLVSGGGSVPLNIGDLYALLSGMFWAIGASMIVRYSKVPVPGMIIVQFLATSLFAILLGGAVATIAMPGATAIRESAGVATATSVLVFLPAVWSIFWAQKYLFPGRAGLLMMSEALTAVISASLLLPEERMSLVEWTGALLIISACLIEILLTPREHARST